MLDIRIVIGIFAILHSAYGDCSACTNEYNTDKDAANGNETLMCHAVKDYVTCLEGKLNGASCTLNATEAQVIQEDLTGTCGLSEACTCQKEFFEAEIDCSTAKARISCLKGKMDEACDGTTNVITLATATETYINGVGSCPLSGTTCECEVTYAKADISSNANKCTKTKEYVACLKENTGTGCVATDTVMALATAAGTTLSGIGETDCPLSGTTCECEVTYAKANISSDPNMCTALKNEISCLVGKTGNACDGSTTVTSLAATIADNIIGTSGCNVTETCQCQIDFTKASVTAAKKCSSAKTYSTCIGNVNNATELGCDEVTQQDSIKTTSSVIQKEFCSASGLRVASLLLVLPAALFYL